MKRLLIISAILGSLLFTGAIFAQKGPGDMSGKHFKRMAKMLDLNDEQISKMTDMHLQMQKDMIPLRSKMQTLKGELKLVQTADKFELGKAEKIVKEMQALRTQMEMNRIKHQQEMRSLLNDDQRKKFDAHLLSGGPKGPRGPKGRFDGPHEKHGHGKMGQDRDN